MSTRGNNFQISGSLWNKMLSFRFFYPLQYLTLKIKGNQFLVHCPICVFLCIVTGTFYWIIKIEAFLSGNTFNGSLLPPSYTSHIHTHTHSLTHTHTYTQKYSIHIDKKNKDNKIHKAKKNKSADNKTSENIWRLFD